MRLLLARHGQTDENAFEIFQGQRGRGLNAAGIEQARRLATRLAMIGVRAIVSSDLERASQTARIVADATGAPVTFDAGLREVDVGAWTGLSYDEAAARFPDEWGAWRAGIDVRRGGGETYAELGVRVEAAVRRAADVAPAVAARAARDGHVVVVSHGAALKSLAAKILGLPPQGMRALAGMSNAALTTVALEADALRLVAWNDAAHLEDGSSAGER